MARVTLKGVHVTGVVGAVPGEPIDVSELGRQFSEAEVQRIARAVGLQQVHRAKPGQTTADLCFAAAQQLLERIGWNRESVDALILVTQTSDYRLPATACVLQERLGLSKECLAFDVNLGCSGYTYGLWLAAQMIQSGTCCRVLLLTGDVLSPLASTEDRGVVFLYGDAGSATAVEKGSADQTMSFVLRTDGKGKDDFIIPAGGTRWPHDQRSAVLQTDPSGNRRTAEHIYMNGMEVLNFTMREVPPLVLGTLEQHGWDKDDVDMFLFHQANGLIITHLVRKLGLPADKVPINIQKFGNTNGAAIPLLMADAVADRLLTGQARVLMAGFGVGYSWAGVALDIGPLLCAEICHS